MSDTPQGPGWWMATDHKWYPPEEAPAPGDERFAPPTPISVPLSDPAEPAPPLPIADDGKAPADGRSRRPLLVLIAVLLVALIGLGAAIVVTLQSDKGDDTSREAPDPTASSTAPDAAEQSDDAATEGDAEPAADEQALEVAASAYGPVLAIDVLSVGDETYGLAAIETDQGGPGESGLVRIWISDGSTWTETDPVTSPLSISSWSRSDVTGDGEPDLVVELFTGNGIGGGVLSAASGQMMFTGFLLTDGFLANYVDGPLRVEAAGLTSNVNSCDPNCVDGATVTDVWQYDPARDQFLVSDEAGQ